MKKLELRTFLFYLVLTSMTLISIGSCVNKKNNENHSILEQINGDIDNKIDSQILTDVVESNLKVIKISRTAQAKSVSDSTKNILKEIEQEHHKLNLSIKNIAKKNLIIIPDTLYDVDLPDTLINIGDHDYIYLSEVENSLKEEIKKLQTILKSSTNIDLKIFSVQALVVLKNNLKKVNQELN